MVIFSNTNILHDGTNYDWSVRKSQHQIASLFITCAIQNFHPKDWRQTRVPYIHKLHPLSKPASLCDWKRSCVGNEAYRKTDEKFDDKLHWNAGKEENCSSSISSVNWIRKMSNETKDARLQGRELEKEDGQSKTHVCLNMKCKWHLFNLTSIKSLGLKMFC